MLSAAVSDPSAACSMVRVQQQTVIKQDTAALLGSAVLQICDQRYFTGLLFYDLTIQGLSRTFLYKLHTFRKTLQYITNQVYYYSGFCPGLPG